MATDIIPEGVPEDGIIVRFNSHGPEGEVHFDAGAAGSVGVGGAIDCATPWDAVFAALRDLVRAHQHGSVA